jgi:predicted enzyme related to lactoylglutathione lyase
MNDAANGCRVWATFGLNYCGSVMALSCCHVMLNVSDVETAKEFYADVLGLPLLEAFPKFFAVRAGDVRVSVFPGGTKRPADAEEDSALSLILRTDDLDSTIQALTAKGVIFEGDPMEAPKFMRYISFLDPDGNRLYLAQYFADPLAAL